MEARNFKGHIISREQIFSHVSRILKKGCKENGRGCQAYDFAKFLNNTSLSLSQDCVNQCKPCNNFSLSLKIVLINVSLVITSLSLKIMLINVSLVITSLSLKIVLINISLVITSLSLSLSLSLKIVLINVSLVIIYNCN